MQHKKHISKGNILVIMADQLTAKALGCYGNNDVHSPRIDEMGINGVIFESAYSSSPLCTPARYAFMTGQYVSRCRGYDNASYLPATMPTFAHYLRLMGYYTCLSGKMHYVGPDQLHGFEDRVTTDIYPSDFGWVPDWTNGDERIDLWYHNMSSVKQAGVAAITNQITYDEEVGNAALRVIYDHARGEDPRPLCLVASFIHPHDPYATRQKYWDCYDSTAISPPSVPRPTREVQDAHGRRLEQVIALDAVDISPQDIIRARRAYYSNVTYFDEWAGRLVDALGECGMAENTTVVILSDHGDMLGEHGLWYKMSFREWSARIPLIIFRPKRFVSRRVSQPVSQVDLLPTLLEIASEHTGRRPPDPIDPLDGHSVLPLADGDADLATDPVIAEYLAEGTTEPMLMIRSGALKFTQCSGDPEQLFDLETDPDEQTNLASSPAMATEVKRFRTIAANHWDSDSIRQSVIADQARRRAVHAALRIGRYQNWDFQPGRDASSEYTRSHHDLTHFDDTSRYPRPPAFHPRWK